MGCVDTVPRWRNGVRDKQSPLRGNMPPSLVNVSLFVEMIERSCKQSGGGGSSAVFKQCPALNKEPVYF